MRIDASCTSIASQWMRARSSARSRGSLLIGALPLGLGALAWDNGIRRGDRRVLAIMAYATPLVSALILILCGYATPSIGIVLGGALIVAAGAVSASR